MMNGAGSNELVPGLRAQAPEPFQALQIFRSQQLIAPENIGALCTMLFVTRTAREKGLPLNPAAVHSRRDRQVAGLNANAVRRVLADYARGELRIGEAGRTNRMNLMRADEYVQLLNRLHAAGDLDLMAVERWWAEQLPERSLPRLRFRFRPARSTTWTVCDLLRQLQHAGRNQPQRPTTEKVLTYLVYAVLATVPLDAGTGTYSVGTIIEALRRHAKIQFSGIFVFVSLSSAESRLKDCWASVRSQHRTMLFTLEATMPAIAFQAEELGLSGGLDIIGIETFLRWNLQRLRFSSDEEHEYTVRNIVDCFNQMVDACETDSSLRIAFAR